MDDTAAGAVTVALSRQIRVRAWHARRRLVRMTGVRPGPDAVTTSARRRAVGDITQLTDCGIFDPQWYAQEAGLTEEDPERLLRHYLGQGEAQGFNPGWAFEAGWYRRSHRLRGDVSPLVHFVAEGAGAKFSPHPLFDPSHVARDHEDSRRHPLGPFGWYQTEGRQADVEPHPLLHRAVRERLRERTGAGTAWWDAVVRTTSPTTLVARRHERFVRDTTTFDHAAASRWKSGVRAAVAALPPAEPLVSVVIPTKNRPDGTREAVRSVLSQTWPHVQCIVVDDGSTDATPDLLEDTHGHDPRLVVLRRPESGGVSVARNTGLAVATGELVAYLDSDNTWEPDFLELMVATLRTTGARAAYSASELRETAGERRLFRGRPFDPVELRLANYVDCICLVHERALLDEVGGFEETLRRAVDWDLILRIAEVTPLEYAPFVGTVYDIWAEDPDRLTLREPMAASHAVRLRALERATADPVLTAPTAAVLPVAQRGASASAVLAALRQDRDDLPVLVVDGGTGVDDAHVLGLLPLLHDDVTLVRTDVPLSQAATVGYALRLVEAEELLLLDPRVRPVPGCAGRLLEAVRRDPSTVASPVILTQQGTVLAAGAAFSPTGTPYPLLEELPGDAPEVVGGPVPGLAAAAFAVRSEVLAAAGTVDPAVGDGFAALEWSLRLVASGARLVVEPAAVGIGPAGPLGKRDDDLQEWLRVRARLRVEPPCGNAAIEAAAGLLTDGWATARGTRETHLPRPVLRRQDRSRRRWALKIGPRDALVRHTWGDWHFAVALGRELRALDQDVVIDCRDAWYRRTDRLDDVTLTIRGVRAFEPDPGAVNLAWVISHPGDVTDAELARYDRVLVASEPFTRRLRERGVEAHTLLQATDPERFSVDVEPVTERYGALFVGNSRGRARPVVMAAVEGELPLTVYGANWKGLLDERYVAGTYLDNDRVAAHYRAADAVLNDHWDDMAREGFLSNRLFDLAACGAAVVSDDVPGLHDLFPDVAVWRPGDDIAERVAQAAGTPEDRRRATAQMVREEHSFAARARRLVEAVEQLDA